MNNNSTNHFKIEDTHLEMALKYASSFDSLPEFKKYKEQRIEREQRRKARENNKNVTIQYKK